MYGAPDAYLVETTGTTIPATATAPFLVPNPQAGTADPTYNPIGPNAKT